MGAVSGIVVYVIMWWLVFFMMLPLGVHPPHEVGEEAGAGHEAGAPVRHYLVWKLVAATVISGILWGVAYWIIVSEMVTFRGS